MTRTLGDMESIRALATVLSKCQGVIRYDQGSENEAWTLAYALSDIEESIVKIYADKIPRLLMAHASSEINELLLEIGEELRHVLYHIRDPKFFRYLDSGS